MPQCRTTLNLSQHTRILNAPSFLMGDEDPRALTEYLPDYHGSLSVDTLETVVLAFTGQCKQCRSPGFAGQHEVLHSKHELQIR